MIAAAIQRNLTPPNNRLHADFWGFSRLIGFINIPKLVLIVMPQMK